MEAMGIEQLVEAIWQLEEFLVKVRCPVIVPQNYSDVDVVGVKKTDVRLAECKVRGSAREVFGYSEEHGSWISIYLSSFRGFRVFRSGFVILAFSGALRWR